MKHWPFKVVADEAGKPRLDICVGGNVRKQFTPEEISAMVLVKVCNVDFKPSNTSHTHTHTHTALLIPLP